MNREKWKKIVGNLRGKMGRRRTHPCFAHLIETVLVGQDPRLEDIGLLRLNQCVRRLYKRHDTVGWEKISDGIIVKGVGMMQSTCEEYKFGKGQRRPKDPKETVAHTMAYCML